MARYSVSIRELDSVAKARGEFMGLTFWGDTVEAASPAIAREMAIRAFLTPLDVAALGDASREHGAKLEAMCEEKRKAYRAGQCEVIARKSKAKA